MILLLAAGFACRRDDGTPPDAVRAALEARGMGVLDGMAARLDSDCCVDDNCLLANPDNDYIGWWLPRPDEQTEQNPRERPDGLSHIWRLRADEAVVAIGTTPPASAYFSYRSYLDDRYFASIDGRDRLMVNLGDSLNQFALHTGAGGPFSAPFALVATADARTLATVTEALAAAGIPRDNINVDVIAANAEAIPDGQPLQMGLHAEADTFRMNNRLALFEDEAEGERYLDDPPVSVWRVTPLVQQVADPLPVPALRPRGDGRTEEAWREAVDALEAAILAAHPDQPHLALKTIVTDTGDDCPPGCNRDTFFAVTWHYLLPETPDASVMVFGVNHERTGKSVYSNFSIIEVEHLSSYAAVHSRDMPGSARRYLPDHPLADDLYAWRVARTCEPADPYCIAVPYACPGFAAEVQGSIAFRAYPEPTTATGPASSELVADRAIWFADLQAGP